MILNYTQSGTGSHVVLLHGLFGSADNLSQLAKYLSEFFLVTNIDLRNHGASQHADSHTYYDMATDLLATLKHLNIERCHLFGHSMGGKTAMTFAMLHPEKVASLVVEDIAPVRYANRHQDVFTALNQLDLSQVENRKQVVNQLNEQINSLGISQFLAKNLQKDDGNWRWKMNLAVLQLAYPEIAAFPDDLAKAYEGATLFIKGMNSDYLMPQHQNDILQRFPKAQVKVIQGTGHWVHAEKPNIFNKIVADFLQKQEC
ncbi:alpha/beta fold hydrolase [Catenovulum agarivorans]|uniref:alpha/beta fold hydrolase n=1 Tax=Catenovulum agarivorans TaxID=1172192 RepID=UPI0002EA0717|nr:alpha/beta fold hydrolase [Catenovulum agarivorans]